MHENFEFKLKAAIAGWSISTDRKNELFTYRASLHPSHIESLTQHLMPIMEEIIQLAREANVKTR
jgi:hypothetical protein